MNDMFLQCLSKEVILVLINNLLVLEESRALWVLPETFQTDIILLSALLVDTCFM